MHTTELRVDDNSGAEGVTIKLSPGDRKTVTGSGQTLSFLFVLSLLLSLSLSLYISIYIYRYIDIYVHICIHIYVSSSISLSLSPSILLSLCFICLVNLYQSICLSVCLSACLGQTIPNVFYRRRLRVPGRCLWQVCGSALAYSFLVPLFSTSKMSYTTTGKRVTHFETKTESEL